ncbi:MAG: acetyl-CoA carboxylase biotin carboxyl carrier protein [Puniceicoccales bacterium]|nr:acetyl-CoA carboxylase biotin carboxyl carrier protein [Puniceicoccales bacterium]
MNIEEIEELANLVKVYDLEELELSKGDFHIHLIRRRSELDVLPLSARGASEVIASATSVPYTSPKEEEDCRIRTISSPMVGTFYRAPAPDRPAFVEIGSAIKKNTTVCILEAMKVLNEIPAEVNGVIVDVLVSDGHAVEFGQPLFKVRVSE